MFEPESRFYDSLKLTDCPAHYTILLQALWHDGNGNWHKAHDLINDLSGADEAWIHAYLHRKEGDLSNANYWYRRASKRPPNYTLEQEWRELVTEFTNR